MAFFGVFGVIDVEAYFATGSLWAFIAAGFFLYLVGLVMPFVSLLWVMMIKFFLDGDIYKNNVPPGCVPQVEQDASANWCIGRRLEPTFKRPNGRAAPACRPCSPRELLQDRDASRHRRQCDGRPRHVDHSVYPHPHQRRLAGAIGGTAARCSGRCTELKRTAITCQYASPTWLLETLNVLMQILLSLWLIVVPAAAISWFARALIPAGEAELSGESQDGAAVRDRLATYSLHVHHHLGRRRRNLFAGLPLHPLDGRFTRAVPLARAGALSSCTE